jgi:hypothetical protein
MSGSAAVCCHHASAHGVTKVSSTGEASHATGSSAARVAWGHTISQPPCMLRSTGPQTGMPMACTHADMPHADMPPAHLGRLLAPSGCELQLQQPDPLLLHGQGSLQLLLLGVKAAVRAARLALRLLQLGGLGKQLRQKAGRVPGCQQGRDSMLWWTAAAGRHLGTCPRWGPWLRSQLGSCHLWFSAAAPD